MSYYRRALADATTDHIRARQIVDSDAAVAVLERRSDFDTYLSRRTAAKPVDKEPTLEDRVTKLETEVKGLQKKAKASHGSGTTSGTGKAGTPGRGVGNAAG
jgi:hypothetical protein